MVKFLDLKRINARYEDQFKSFFNKFLSEGHYVLGSAVSSFEDAFAEYCSVKHCLGVANGLDALELILNGLQIQGRLQKGDEILVPANTFIASILAISNCDMVPVLVDPNESTFNMHSAGLAEKVTPKTKAILGVHLYGQLFDVDGLEKFSKEKGLILLEDAAQAHGARRESRRAGALGEAAGFSFYPGKNLGCLGDGGAITTNNTELFEILRALRNYGCHEKYVHVLKGRNSRLDEVQAGFLEIKLRDLEELNDRRREIARSYLERMQNPRVGLPLYSGGEDHVFHLFVVRVEQRDLFLAHLQNHGVSASVHYPMAPYNQGAYKSELQGSFPVSDRLHAQVVSLPLDPSMSPEEVEEVIRGVNSF